MKIEIDIAEDGHDATIRVNGGMLYVLSTPTRERLTQLLGQSVQSVVGGGDAARVIVDGCAKPGCNCEGVP